MKSDDISAICKEASALLRKKESGIFYTTAKDLERAKLICGHQDLRKDITTAIKRNPVMRNT